MDDLAPRRPAHRSPWNWWNLLLAIPFIALLWVPFYNSIEPMLWGIPFFYWYQFLWVFITSALIVFVQHRTDTEQSRAP